MSNLKTSWQCDEAVTAVDNIGDWLFAGTISGKIHSLNLKTYQVGPQIEAHTSSIVVLLVRQELVITGSGDSLVKLWKIDHSTGALSLLSTIYCLCDVGDIFCVEYVGSRVYLGTQNASIHWADLHLGNSPTQSHASLHPAIRPNRFFDSAGPGGKLAPQQHLTRDLHQKVHGDETLIEIPLTSAVNFAHNGFVYAMVATNLNGVETLLTGSSDGTVKSWEITEGGLEHKWTLDVGDSVLGMTLFSNWQLYCSLESGHVVTIDLETQQMMKRLVRPNVPLLTLSIVGDAVYLAGGRSLLRYDAITKVSLQWTASDEITATAAIKNRANHMVSGSRDGKIAIWNVSDTQFLPNKHDDSIDTLCACLDDNSMIECLCHLISYRSVSREDQKFWDECRKCATSIRDICRKLGASADLLKIDDGNPVVFAQFRASKAAAASAKPARVLFYGHYDVIDADPTKWQTPPFEMVSGDGYLYGRGTSDNKGPAVAALYAAAELHKAGTLANDVVFLIEGEEERGSFGLYNTIQANLEKIGRFDWIIFSNSYWLDDEHPCINHGLRGVVVFDLEVKNNKADVHSGVDGGTLREPALDMISVLAALTDPKTSECIVPGFLENVLQPSAEDLERFRTISEVNPKFSAQDLESRWCTPTVTVHSMSVSGQDDASVIPSTVNARVSFRIVPNQTTAEIFAKTKSHIHTAFDSLASPNSLSIKCVYDAEPWLGDIKSEPYAIMEAALRREWGEDPLFIREGGSIPMARALETLFDAPAVQLPCGQSSDGAHLKNERFRVTNLVAARKVFKDLFGGVKPREGGQGGAPPAHGAQGQVSAPGSAGEPSACCSV